MNQILEISTIAERSDVHGIWVGEDIGRGYDIFIQASVAMHSAPNKIIGIGVTSPLVRNISTIARAAATLREIDPARFRLGLGVGGLQDLARLGLAIKNPGEMLGSVVNALRRIWTGETLTLQAGNFELEQFVARYRPGFTIPLYLGVRGPRLLGLAGRIADGVIVSGPLPYLEKAVKIIKAEAPRRELRSRLRLVFWLPTIVVRKRADREFAKSVAATVIADTPPNVLEMSGISEDAVKNVRKIARERGYTAASNQVTDELLSDFTISGDARHVCEGFQSLAKLGAHEIVFGPPYGTHPLRSIREVVKAWGRL
jgi:5,10-methylenetetrahydromethanopterin reductase